LNPTTARTFLSKREDRHEKNWRYLSIFIVRLNHQHSPGNRLLFQIK